MSTLTKRNMDVLHNPQRNLRRTSSTQSCSSAKSWKSLGSVCKATVEPTKHTKRVTFGKQCSVRDTAAWSGLTACIITSSTAGQREVGGANNPAVRQTGWVPRTDSECQFPAPGVTYLTGDNTTLTSLEVKLSETVPELNKAKCNYFPKYVYPRPFKEQATQTLYRESSTQTLPYLPDIMDKEIDEQLELFNLASLLPGDQPPGLYEVEILERARKRWAFNKALRTNFKQQLYKTREQLLNSKYKTIMQAFEWERWIEREEHIQECQMMRLEIVIRMFDKREKEMHIASKTRIEQACQHIEQRRQLGLAKNATECKRALRRAEIKRSNKPRKWIKETSLFSMASPCSEYYAPMIRHGQDPARRHFVSGRKAFDMRIDELEKRIDMTRLQCPFSKLRKWSKPKEIVKEYEQNFCSDNKLQKLYESLKGLRTQASQQKAVPKCLKKKQPPPEEDDQERIQYDFEDIDYSAFYARQSLMHIRSTLMLDAKNKIETDLPMGHSKEMAKQMLQEQRQETIESLLCMYEGTTIGWIMQFLSEEMERLKEQRKLHFFSILAQKERWRREAAEAGLRQKENDMRLLYEEMFQETNMANNEVTEEYINSILTTDMAHVAERNAAEVITDLAKQIDKDILRWLDSFKCIQTPLTFEPLRYALKDMIFPDIHDRLENYEKSAISAYIIEDILFPQIWDTLEPFDISSTLTNDLIDRLIDNDLFLFSSDSEGEGRTSKREAEAIIRKLIRQAISGRRWKTETERIAHENYNDLFDDVFTKIFLKMENESSDTSSETSELREVMELLHVQDFIKSEEANRSSSDIIQDLKKEKSTVMFKFLNIIKKVTNEMITRDLSNDEVYIGDDDINDNDEGTLVSKEMYEKPEGHELPENESIPSIFGTFDLPAVPDFNVLRTKSVCSFAKPILQTPSEQSTVEFEPKTVIQPQVEQESEQLFEDSNGMEENSIWSEYPDYEYVTDESDQQFDYQFYDDYEEENDGPGIMSLSQATVLSQTESEEEEKQMTYEQRRRPMNIEESEEGEDEEVEIRD